MESEIRILLLPKDAADEKNVILEVRAGTGGDEAALFAGDLLRMYQRYADLQGWKVAIMEESPGEVGGYKEVIANISGKGAYARHEVRVRRAPRAARAGDRRLRAASTPRRRPSRCCPRSRTSTSRSATEDIRIDTMRSSGAGGQHVNTTDSAVRITHLPTGIVVTSRHEERSTRTARRRWWCCARGSTRRSARRATRRASEARREQVGSGDRSERIRTYNFPQGRVTDHRINLTLYKLDKVIAGRRARRADRGADHREPGGAARRDGGRSAERADASASPGAQVRDRFRAAGHRYARARCAAARRDGLRPRAASISSAASASRSRRRRAGRARRARRSAGSRGEPVGAHPRREGVLRPRLHAQRRDAGAAAETEMLVDVRARALPTDQPQPAILDLGTGTGCIAIALLAQPAAGAGGRRSTSAPRRSPCARHNAERHGVDGPLRCSRRVAGSTPLAAGRAVRPDRLQPALYRDRRNRRRCMPEVRDHDPSLALDGGPGRARRLSRHRSRGAASRLKPGGLLVLEIGADQGDGGRRPSLGRAGSRRSRSKKTSRALIALVAAPFLGHEREPGSRGDTRFSAWKAEANQLVSGCCQRREWRQGDGHPLIGDAAIGSQEVPERTPVSTR